MRKAEFAVPGDAILEFAEEMTSKGLSNEITGVTEDEELIVEVSYSKDESKAIDALEEYLDNLIEQSEEEEGEDD